MPAHLCSERISGISERQEQLTDYRSELVAEMRALGAIVPPKPDLAAIRDELAEAFTTGDPAQCKRLLGAVVESLVAGVDGIVQPELRVPLDGPPAENRRKYGRNRKG